MSSSSHSSVTGNLERLQLHSHSGMAPETRSMRRRAGLSGQTAGSQAPRGTQYTVQDADDADDADDVDDDSEDDDSEDEEDDEDHARENSRPARIWEIWALYDPSYLTPRELQMVAQHRNHYSELTQKYLFLGNVLVARMASTPAVMQRLEQVFPREFCAQQLVKNIEIRYERVVRRLSDNIRTPSDGRDVIDTINSLRGIFAAIDGLILDFPTKSRDLVRILFSILERIFEHDQDAFQGTTRPSYVDANNHGNIYRRFLSESGQPLQFLDVLNRMNGLLLRRHMPQIEALRNTFWYRHPELHQGNPPRQGTQTIRNVWIQLGNLQTKARSG